MPKRRNSKRAAAPKTQPARQARRESRRKAVFCICACAVFLLFALVVGDADYHGTPVGWVPLFALLAGLLLAWVYVRIAAAFFEFADCARAISCKRGQKVAFDMAFRNRTPLFLLRVDVFFFVADADGNPAGEARSTLSLAPFERYEMSFDAALEHVGCYEAGLERVVLYDFLGLFSRTLENDRRSAVCVTPNLVPIEAVRFSEDSQMEAMQAAKATLADSMDYAYVRPYVAGDPLKTIHWKLSARTENYQTRLFEQYTNPGVTVVLDFYAPLQDVLERMSMLDGVVEGGLSVARYAMRNGLDCDIRYHDKHGQLRVLNRYDDDVALDFVRELPRLSDDEEQRGRTQRLLSSLEGGLEGQGNIVVCSANVSAELASAVVGLKMARREPRLVALVPARLVDRDREEYCAPLYALEGAGIGYAAISRSQELAGAVL